MSAIKIQYGVKPPVQKQRGAQPKYSFESMKAGGSFFIAGTKPASVQHATIRFRQSNPKYAGWKFAFEQRKEDGKTGTRCWRMK